MAINDLEGEPDLQLYIPKHILHIIEHNILEHTDFALFKSDWEYLEY